MSSASDFRLHPETSIGGVRLEVSELKRSIAYYSRVIGFSILKEEPGRAVLGTPDGIALLHLIEHPGALPMPQRGRLGLYHFAILLPDRASLARFLVHLGETGARAGSADHLVSEALYLHDPDGLGIEVYSDRPRESWKHEGGEVVMASLPLDVAGLVREAGNERWTGLPPGTRVGHVHLHVGDIEKARAFYDTGLGLDAMVSSYPGALFLSAGGYHHHLGLNTWAGPHAELPRPGHARLAEWELLFPDVDEAKRAVSSLKAAGIEVVDDDGSWRTSDPWGTALRLSAG